MDTYRPEQAWIDGTNFDAQKLFGARAEPNGVSFSVWAPNARSVRVTGDFCSWSDSAHWLSRGDLGVWRGFVPGARAGQLYKYIIEGADGSVVWKADPFALAAEVRPGTASRIAGRGIFMKSTPVRGGGTRTGAFIRGMSLPIRSCRTSRTWATRILSFCP